MNKFILYLI